ncbi:segregation/condensation protein A [bacterium]|nr:segregation/condensation protein A [bacterium]NUN44360.1 segregation/condensation protein A [bacterium]
MYRVKLEQFEGPLDLLLFFVRKDELNIYDIPIAYITKQYLEYLHLMRTLNLDIAGEFILMAATLMRIKAKMMLPPDPTTEEEEELIDPRQELSRRLVEYRQFKEASKSLAELDEYWRSVYRRSYFNFDLIPQQTEEAVGLKDISFFDLLTAYKNAMAKKPAVIYHNVERLNVTVEEQQEYIMDFFRDRNMYTFLELVEDMSKIEVVVTFLALLDLVKKGEIAARQTTLFDDIWIYKASAYTDEIPDELRADESETKQPIPLNEETVLTPSDAAVLNEVSSDDTTFAVNESEDTALDSSLTEAATSPDSELANDRIDMAQTDDPVQEVEQATVDMNIEGVTDEAKTDAETVGLNEEIINNEAFVAIPQVEEQPQTEYTDTSEAFADSENDEIIDATAEENLNSLSNENIHSVEKTQSNLSSDETISVSVNESTEADFYTQVPSENISSAQNQSEISHVKTENIDSHGDEFSNEETESLDRTIVNAADDTIATDLTASITEVTVDENVTDDAVFLATTTEDQTITEPVPVERIRTVIAESQVNVNNSDAESVDTITDNAALSDTEDKVIAPTNELIVATAETNADDVDQTPSQVSSNEIGNNSKTDQTESDTIIPVGEDEPALIRANDVSTTDIQAIHENELTSEDVIERAASEPSQNTDPVHIIEAIHNQNYETIQPDLVKPLVSQDEPRTDGASVVSAKMEDDASKPLTEQHETADATLSRTVTNGEKPSLDEMEKPSIITVFVRKIVSFVKRFFGK